MTSIIYSGVEIPSNRTLLEKAGVKHVMLNFWGLRKRGLPTKKDYYIAEHFHEDMKVWIDSGATQADKSPLSERELEQYMADYEDFIANNYDRIEGWMEFDSVRIGHHRVVKERAAFENDPKMMVVWHEDYGIANLRLLTDSYSKVCIPHDAIESVKNLSAVLQSFNLQPELELYAVGTAKPDNLRQVPFDFASTLSWTSPMRRGETIVWDGQRIVRYPKKMKDQARKRYSSIASQAGIDFDKFVKDEGTESTKLAVWSYQQLEKKMSKDKPDLRLIKGDMPNIEDLVADISDDTLHTGLMEFGEGSSDTKDIEERNNVRPKTIVRDPGERTQLPVFGYKTKTVVEKDDDGNEVLREVPIVESKQDTLRQCNTCFVASNCPAFKPDNTCAFNLPVEVRTKDQLKSLLNAIIEMQGQRVAFMRYAEEMNGGYSDPNVSQEIDRLFKLVKNMKELEENKEFVRITAERQSSQGVLSAIFGDKVSALREMDQPISETDTTSIIKDSLED